MRPAEADLVDGLRGRAVPLISLLAIDDGGGVIGHILFTPVVVESDDASFDAIALGPMAVLPEFQRNGIGSALVRAGLDACRRAGHSVVFVVGRPDFYPRFGFLPAATFGIRCKYPVPDDTFMVAELLPGALRGRRGVVRYLPEFDQV